MVISMLITGLSLFVLQTLYIVVMLVAKLINALYQIEYNKGKLNIDFGGLMLMACIIYVISISLIVCSLKGFIC